MLFFILIPFLLFLFLCDASLQLYQFHLEINMRGLGGGGGWGLATFVTYIKFLINIAEVELFGFIF